MENVATIVNASTQPSNTQDCFGIFIAEAHPKALRFTQYLFGADHVMAEDIVQKASLAVWRHLDKYTKERAVPAWFRQIILNEVRSYFRWRRVRRLAHVTLGLLAVQSPVVTLDHGLRSRLSAALDTLSLRQREVFVLVYLQQHSVKESAQMIGCAEGTAKTHLYRAVHQLRDELGDLWRTP